MILFSRTSRVLVGIMRLHLVLWGHMEMKEDYRVDVLLVQGSEPAVTDLLVFMPCFVFP